MAPLLCFPTLALEGREKIVTRYSKAVTDCFNDLGDKPELFPRVFEDDKSGLQMNNYLIHNHKKFNTSQSAVLEQVIEMPRDDIMLIQGPPGTGKT